jgi:hypothetical protein
VTAEMQLRGDAAEYYVLERVWQKFIKSDEKEEIVNRLQSEWEKNKDLWQPNSLQSFEQYHTQLLDCQAGDPKAFELFKSLIHLGPVGLAGFDILDPFNDWRSKDSVEKVRWVEVKAIRPNDIRIILTIHELRTAKDKDNYILRLINVPDAFKEEQVNEIQFYKDKPVDPEFWSSLEKQLISVGSGKIPIYLS